MTKYRIVETITETSLGPRSSYAVEEKRLFWWVDISTSDWGSSLTSILEAKQFLKRHITPDKKIIHEVF